MGVLTTDVNLMRRATVTMGALVVNIYKRGAGPVSSSLAAAASTSSFKSQAKKINRQGMGPRAGYSPTFGVYIL